MGLCETEQRRVELAFVFGNWIPTEGMRRSAREESIEFPSHTSNLVSEDSPKI
jgi:hypothetical protein